MSLQARFQLYPWVVRSNAPLMQSLMPLPLTPKRWWRAPQQKTYPQKLRPKQSGRCRQHRAKQEIRVFRDSNSQSLAAAQSHRCTQLGYLRHRRRDSAHLCRLPDRSSPICTSKGHIPGAVIIESAFRISLLPGRTGSACARNCRSSSRLRRGFLAIDPPARVVDHNRDAAQVIGKKVVNGRYGIVRMCLSGTDSGDALRAVKYVTTSRSRASHQQSPTTGGVQTLRRRKLPIPRRHLGRARASLRAAQRRRADNAQISTALGRGALMNQPGESARRMNEPARIIPREMPFGVMPDQVAGGVVSVRSHRATRGLLREPIRHRALPRVIGSEMLRPFSGPRFGGISAEAERANPRIAGLWNVRQRREIPGRVVGIPLRVPATDLWRVVLGRRAVPT